MAELRPGDHLTGSLKRLGRARIYANSAGLIGDPGFPRIGYHTDDSAGRAAGFSSMLVSGTMIEGYLLQLLVSTFDDRWFHGGKLDVRFLKPVYEDDEIRAHGLVRSVDGTRVELEVWCENQRGEKVLVGTASATLE